jgi:holo-[acyl-carrier protein] synthase
MDLVEVARIAELAGRHGQRFLERIFTAGEIEYAMPRAARYQHLAGRFAAKEAVFKALGTGWSPEVGWKNVEVVSDARGRPEARLTGGAARRLESLGGSRVHLSITHTRGLAAASAVVEG